MRVIRAPVSDCCEVPPKGVKCRSSGVGLLVLLVVVLVLAWPGRWARMS